MAAKQGKRSRAEEKFRGVKRRGSAKWSAEIRDGKRGIRKWIGTFSNAEAAARAYDAEAIKIKGIRAKLNFPDASVWPGDFCSDSSPAPPPSHSVAPPTRICQPDLHRTPITISADKPPSPAHQLFLRDDWFEFMHISPDIFHHLDDAWLVPLPARFDATSEAGLKRRDGALIWQSVNGQKTFLVSWSGAANFPTRTCASPVFAAEVTDHVAELTIRQPSVLRPKIWLWRISQTHKVGRKKTSKGMTIE